MVTPETILCSSIKHSSHPHLPGSSDVKIFHVVDGAIQASERPYYYWLLSPLPELKIAPETVGSSEVRPFSTLWTLKMIKPRLDAVSHADEVALIAEVDTKIDRHVNLHKPQESGMSTEQYSEASKVWASKYGDKRRKYEDLCTKLFRTDASSEQLKILVYELAFFLKLISFETAFKVLRKHRQDGRYTGVLVNTLGDSLLDGGEQLDKFDEQLETTFETIGYSPEDLQTFEGVAASSVAGTFRDIVGELIFDKKYGPKRQEFVERMWRAACTLHLTAFLQSVTGQRGIWEEEFAPALYRAIDVGSTEVFDQPQDPGPRARGGDRGPDQVGRVRAGRTRAGARSTARRPRPPSPVPPGRRRRPARRGG